MMDEGVEKQQGFHIPVNEMTHEEYGLALSQTIDIKKKKGEKNGKDWFFGKKDKRSGYHRKDSIR